MSGPGHRVCGTRRPPPDIVAWVPLPYTAGGPATPIPVSADLRSGLLPIRDQGDSSQCTPFAICAAKEFQDKTGAYLSTDFVYDRRPDKSDTGMFIIDAINVLTNVGVCTREKYGKPDQLTNAAKHTIKRVADVRNLLSAKAALAVGRVIVLSVPYYPDAPDAKFWQTKGKTKGGHTITIVGYNDVTSTMIIRNSWGEDWVDNGYGTMSYNEYQTVVWEAYTLVDGDTALNPEAPDIKKDSNKSSNCCDLM